MQKRLFNNRLLNIIAIIIFSLALIVGLASCSSNKGDKVREKKKTEVTKEKAESKESADSSGTSDESTSETNDDEDSAKKAREKTKEKERAKAKEAKAKKNNGDSSSNNSSHSKKRWVPAVYKTVTHPAVTRQQKVVDYYTCQCGRTFKTHAEWEAHKPKP